LPTAHLFDVIIVGIAAWRIAHLLVLEDGPLSIFERIRTFIGLQPGPVQGFFPQLFSCMWCMTVWTALGAYLLWLLVPIIVAVVAAMSIAIAFQQIFESEK
jgi:hypothetical protein